MSYIMTILSEKYIFIFSPGMKYQYLSVAI